MAPLTANMRGTRGAAASVDGASPSWRFCSSRIGRGS